MGSDRGGGPQGLPPGRQAAGSRELPAASRVGRNLNALLKISRVVHSTSDLNQLQGQILELIFEVVPAERVVPGAITWCREMLSLPRGSMSITRQQARSNLVALFEKDLKPELEMVMANWCDDETQSVLRAVRERLAKKKR